MLSRIRDGNGIAPPRNLIDLVTKAEEAQLRKEQRGATEFKPTSECGVIQSDAVRHGLSALSTERVEDTLLAEAGDYAAMIERFRDGRAEQNEESLAATLGNALEDVKERVQPLIEIGFLERTGDSYKVPMFYRTGLSVTQGRHSRLRRRSRTTRSRKRATLPAAIADRTGTTPNDRIRPRRWPLRPCADRPA